jgi:NAD(P)-dependent dehydrogenase (short-subunit alcohol dehydrogenase family)
VRARPLDVTDPASVAALAAWLGREVGRVDLLVNNAAATSVHGEKPSSADLGQARDAMDATLFGA